MDFDMVSPGLRKAAVRGCATHLEKLVQALQMAHWLCYWHTGYATKHLPSSSSTGKSIFCNVIRSLLKLMSVSTSNHTNVPNHTPARGSVIDKKVLVLALESRKGK